MSGGVAVRRPPLLRVRGLAVSFGGARAVDGVDLDLERGAALALVGESGCGKSLTALALLGLVPPPGRVSGDELSFDGRDLLALREDERRALRGRRIAMVFQDPTAALNPVFTAGEQVAEVLRLHRGLDRAAARRAALEALREVGLPAERVLEAYPHQLSGGMRQRVTIAMALAGKPQLLLCDEPTTSLDVVVQAGILELLADLRERTGAALLFVSHDLGVVARVAERTAVMYAGRVVESGPTGELLRAPRHPYTAALLAARPERAAPRTPLAALPGRAPRPAERPPGCSFRPRCARAGERDAARCAAEDPALTAGRDALRRVACHFPLDEGGDEREGERGDAGSPGGRP